jgi:hypothetical protein
MNFKVIQPPHQLADYVRFFWFSEGNASIHKPFVHHAFAYPCPELLFCYKGQFKYNSEFEAERTLSSGIYGQTQTFSKVASKADSAFLDFIYILTLFHNYFAYQQTNSQISLQTLKRSAVKRVKSLKKK